MLDALLAISLASPILAAPQDPPPPEQGAKVGVLDAFAAELQKATRAYAEVTEENGELILAGEINLANRRLQEAVPESERTAAHEFLLGNWFFDIDSELSVLHHRRAWELAPENPVVIAEWATELHRAEQYTAALEYYGDYAARLKATNQGDTPAYVSALRADCLLQLGRLDEAVIAWRDADPRENHQMMGEALIRVHLEPHPLRRRADLLKEVRGGELEKLEELIELDLRWSEHPLDLRINEVTLERDLQLADELLEADAPRRAELELYVDVGRAVLPQILGPRYEGEIKVLSATMLLRRMKALGLWGENARLPHSSLVANQLYDFMLRMGAADLGEILAAFEDPLRERALSVDGDPQACMVLSALQGVGGDPGKSEEILRLGWKRYHEWRSACGLLFRKGEALRLADEDLRQALADFPFEPEVQRFGLKAAQHGDADQRIALLVALTRAELRHLASVAEMPDYFGALGVELSQR